MNNSAQIAFLTYFILLFACETKKEGQKGQTEIEFSKSHTGYYVTDEYDKRLEGYDWIGISVKLKNDTVFLISVRSRSDLKKPTCTFDGEAVGISDNTLKSIFENKPILFTFSNNILEISMEDKQDKDFLHFFCSGGGTLAGRYKKLEKPMDAVQLNSVDFDKELSLQGIDFHVRSINTGFDTKLTVKPSNLKIDNRPVEQGIKGYVTGAEVEDMNSDGFPELLIYTKSMESGIFGSVVGYSVNNGKSMSQIYFPNVKDNPKINQGYFGYDEFTMIETKLGQRFPLFKEKDGKLVSTGKMRQVTYTLADGEAQRFFKIDQVSEY